MHDDSICPFCAPAPAALVAETALTRTLRDAFPVSPGHTLVVPRRHFADAFEATEAEMAEI
jgi:diadenosine tetraphosphate (Ap4A) HIT family hydrolase